MTPTRDNLGVAHENGSIESPHGLLPGLVFHQLERASMRDAPSPSIVIREYGRHRRSAVQGEGQDRSGLAFSQSGSRIRALGRGRGGCWSGTRQI